MKKIKANGNDVILERQFLSIILGQVHGECFDCIKNECMTFLAQYTRKRGITEKEIDSYIDREGQCYCL